MIYLTIWTIALVSALALYLKQVYSRFSRYGVKNQTVVPLLGNMTGMLLQRGHLTDLLTEMYREYSDERFVGRYEFTTPTLLVKDLELIKKITIKDFEHFLDHRGLSDDSADIIFARNLMTLKGEEWKDMRSTLSPAFTSSKIRLMVPFMEEVGKQLIQALKKDIIESTSGYIDVDCKDLTSRFANDVIATCAFGLKVDSFMDKDNTFYEMGRATTTFKFTHLLSFFVSAIFPALAKFLNLKIFSDATRKFFFDLVVMTMKEREDSGLIRHDMIHLLMQAKKGKLTHDENTTNDADAGFATVEESSVGKKKPSRVWSDIDLVAQAVLFFVAGFETVSIGMSFALHELALHPEIQERLFQEIKENELKNNGNLDYTTIQCMKYLDMVVSEVLRLWPPNVLSDRICVKDYNLGKANDRADDYVIRKGELLYIPIWSIHRDVKYFPDPNKFDPERFSDKNKHLIDPITYIPFGLGPRNCIGSRFALCELKVQLYMILLTMEVSPNEKTCTVGKISRQSFSLRLEGGHWLRFKPRSSQNV